MQLIEQDVIANGVRLHVYRSGTDKPPLVFAHGITDNGLCFLPIAEQLAEDFEIVLYDSRGHGRSDPSSRETTLLERARDLGGLVEALGLNKPGLLGHSLGADHGGSVCRPVPAGAGLHRPGRPSALRDSGARRRPGDGERWARWREWAVADKQRSVEELVQISRERDPSWPEAERLPWARAKQQFSLTVFDEERLDDVESVERDRVADRLPDPAHHGRPEMGSLFPAAAAEDLVAGLPRARHVSIPGAGHNIRREQPGLYLEAVRGFLKEHS